MGMNTDMTIKKDMTDDLINLNRYKLLPIITRKKKFNKELEKMLFTKQKKISVEPYIYITTVLLESVKDNRKLELILSLIHIHKETCKDPQCFCHKI